MCFKEFAAEFCVGGLQGVGFCLLLESDIRELSAEAVRGVRQGSELCRLDGDVVWWESGVMLASVRVGSRREVVMVAGGWRRLVAIWMVWRMSVKRRL